MSVQEVSTESVRDQVSEAEWQTRVNLAACYRLIAMNGWDDLIFTHISARVPDSDHHFLLNPMGLLFEEVTASNLVKIDLEGKKVMDSPYNVNAAGFIIHSAIHEAREDAQCVIHLHTDYGVAVSMQKQGLLPHSQTATLPYAITSYHDYEGIAIRPDEKARLVANLGTNFAMILRNHGTLTLGRSVSEAYTLMHFLERACKMQILAQSGGQELIELPEEIYMNILEVVKSFSAQSGSKDGVGSGGADGEGGAWPALLRKLDRIDPSFRD